MILYHLHLTERLSVHPDKLDNFEITKKKKRSEFFNLS